MNSSTFQSSAKVVFLRADHIQEVQIIIDDETLYNNLPGKYERHGVKTLCAWPFFVTAILNEEPEPKCSYALLRHQAELQVREPAPDYQQLPILDLTVASPHRKPRKRQVERTLAEIRKLCDDLNGQLYAHPTERPQVHSPQDVYNLLQPFLGYIDHEEMWVVCLDTRNRVMDLVKLYQGSVNSSQVRVAEIFRQAILDNAPAIIIAHNHPSGDPSPSPEDVSVTRTTVQAGKLLDIDVLDHLVVCRERFVSLKERGLGFA